MSQSIPNFEGRTLGQYVVGNRLTEHSHVHWYRGHKVGAGGDLYWLGFPVSAESTCPDGYISIECDSEDLTLWVRAVPAGAPIRLSLEEGPLSIPSLVRVLDQCAVLKSPTSIDEIWWEESVTCITFVGTTPFSTPKADSFGRLGEVVWHLVTGQAYQGRMEDLATLLPQPLSLAFISSLQSLLNHTLETRPVSSNALANEMKSLSRLLERPPSRSFTRQNTKELWEAPQGKHVSRAAGQPAFFIVGGLVTAAVVYLLAGLGLFPNAPPDKDVPNAASEKHQPANKSSDRETSR